MKAIAIILGVFGALGASLLDAQGNRMCRRRHSHLPVQGNIDMLVGAGANITVQAGDDGVLLVDAGTAAMSDKVLAAIHSDNRSPAHLYRQYR